jgi:hypothetical protein
MKNNNLTETATHPSPRDEAGKTGTDLTPFLCRLMTRTHTFPSFADSDQDGFNDGAEIRSGHNPLDPDDVPPRALSIFTAIELEFPTRAGLVYQLQTSPDFTNWTNLGSPIVGDGNTWSNLYSTRGPEQKYLRLELAP